MLLLKLGKMEDWIKGFHKIDRLMDGNKILNSNQGKLLEKNKMLDVEID